MNSMPTVSVLVPIYGVERFIEKCVRSLFEQTFEDIEYIFVNDCTPDNSIDILKKTLEEYPIRKQNTKIINHRINKGIAVARNTCLKYATGKYTLFVDSDDWLELTMIEFMYNKALEDNSDIVGCDYFINTNDNEIYVKEKYPENKKKLIAAAISQSFFVVLWKLLIKKTLYEKYHIYFDEELRVGEDSVVCFKLAFYSDKISYINQAFYHYNQENSNHLAQKSLENISLWTQAIIKIENLCKEYGIENTYQHHLNLRKFVIKQALIFDPKLRNLKLWHSLFPESSNIWRTTQMPISYKIIYSLLGLHLDYIVHLLFKCQSLIKKIR